MENTLPGVVLNLQIENMTELILMVEKVSWISVYLPNNASSTDPLRSGKLWWVSTARH